MVTQTPLGASVRPRMRKDGSFAFDVRYRLDGASRTLSFEYQKSAEKWANLVRKVGARDALEVLRISRGDESPTVSEYADVYITSKSGVEGKTLDDYQTFMRLHISPTLGDLPIDAVTPTVVSRWINAQSDSGAAAKSIKNRHGFLSAMFQSAVEDALIDRNPCARSNLPEAESQEMVFLSPDEFTTLLGYIPDHYQPLVLFLASTGFRWGEATALKPSDVDLEQLTARVSRAWKYSSSRGKYLGAPKTKRSKRTVSIPSNLAPLLRPLMGGEYLFMNRSGKPVRQSNFYTEVWEPARRLANGLPAYAVTRSKGAAYTPRTGGVWQRIPAVAPIGKTPRVHDLRHSHASWLLGEGVGIDVVSRRLGHESITTTVDRYGHVTAERLHGAANTIGNVLSGAMPEIGS